MKRLTVLMLLFIAAPAHAAALGEQPFVPVPRDGIATCLRATGTPGGLALYARGGVELRDVSTPAARIRLGRVVDCAATATAGGAAVVAAPVRRQERTEVRVVVRDPGGAFSAPVTLGPGAFDIPIVAAAAAPSGAAVVAWFQRRNGDRHRVVAARRAAGGAFGPVEPLTPWRRRGEFSGSGYVTAAMSAAGEATIAWSLPIRVRRDPEAVSVATAHAVPGAPFSLQTLARAVQSVSRVALAVASDGWALLAYDEITGVHVLERPPGAPRFTGAFEHRESFSGAEAPVVAIRNGGGGLAAWRSSFGLDAGVVATVRPAAGPFAARKQLAPDIADDSFGVGVVVATTGGPPLDSDNATLRAALAADGRALLSWGSPRRGVNGATVAAGTLAAGFEKPVALGSPVRDVNGVAPVFLADGRAALAWTDNDSQYGEFPQRTGRLHVAVESAPPVAEPERPGVTLAVARRQRLYASQPLRARVGCDRACDLRVTVSGPGLSTLAVTRTLLRARTVTLGLERFDDRPPRPGPRRVRIRVRATALNGHAVTRAARRVPVVERPARPVPRLLDARAVRRGRSIVVTWRTAGPAWRTYFSVVGQRERRLTPASIRGVDAFGFARGRGRTRFRVRLRPDDPEAVRWVSIFGISADGAPPVRRKVIQVG